MEENELTKYLSYIYLRERCVHTDLLRVCIKCQKQFSIFSRMERKELKNYGTCNNFSSALNQQEARVSFSAWHADGGTLETMKLEKMKEKFCNNNIKLETLEKKRHDDT